jgi:hypothetical protein
VHVPCRCPSARVISHFGPRDGVICFRRCGVALSGAKGRGGPWPGLPVSVAIGVCYRCVTADGTRDQ